MATPAWERFVNLLGGEEHLPPKRERTPSPPPSPPPRPQDDLQPVEDFMKQNLPEKLPSYIEATQKSSPAPSQHAPKPMADPRLPPKVVKLTEAERQYDTRCGEPALEGMKFSPFTAITKFPYKYVPKEWRQPLASAFFDESKVYDREWDMYYVYNGYFPTRKPTTFVPLQQLEALIVKINEEFPDANIELDDKAREELIYDFNMTGTMSKEFRPRFLGHTTKREQMQHWVDNLPHPGNATISTAMQNDAEYKTFVEHMENAIDAGKNKKSNKSKTKSNRAHNLFPHTGGETSTLITNAQRYLGLTPPTQNSIDTAISNLNLNNSSAEPIFIAIDCEAYEEGAHAVTEVGVATLDTRDLRTMPPGPLGENWRQYIRARHFRITERTHMVNKKWIDGCPDKFKFGTSEFVSKDSIASVLTSCFHPPFSAAPKPASSVDDVEEEEEKVEAPRNIILLGHDLKQDIDYCHTLGFAVLNRGNLLDTMDTARMYQSFKRDVNPTSLPKVLHTFDISAWHAHNGGNDAVYTVWAMLAICTEAGGVWKKDAVAGAEQMRMEGQEEGVKMVQKAEENGKPVFGPERPPSPAASGGLYTMGGVPLDV